MLRIERSADRRAVFTLSGRMQTQDIDQVKQPLDVEAPGQQLILDLRDLTLVSQDAVTFLAKCEANGSRSRIALPSEIGSTRRNAEDQAGEARKKETR